MGYTTSGITITGVDEFDGGCVIRARNTNSDKVVQCYLNGELYQWQPTPAEYVEFILPSLEAGEIWFLLAVDLGEETTDYWADAFGVSEDYGNRIEMAVPQVIAPYQPHDRIAFYRGDAGDGAAALKVHEQAFYPGGRRACGFGSFFGYDGFGWDGHDAVGWGYNWGVGEWGFDCEMILYETPPLPPGVYPYKVIITDPAGNDSSPTSGNITLSTYARPCSGLTVAAYNKGTDTLDLSWTASEDMG